MVKNSEEYHISKMKVLSSILVIIFIAEVLIMGLLHFIKINSAINEMILDGLLLTLFSTPLIYYFVIDKIYKGREELLHNLLKQKRALDMSVLVSETDKRGFITYVNDTFCEISGYEECELLGQRHNIVNSTFHSKDFWSDCWATIKRGEVWRADVCNIAKHGIHYWVDTSIMPLLNTEGSVVGYFSVRIDITGKKQMKSQLQHQSKLASIGSLAAGVAHEIKNPLAISIGTLGLIHKLLKDNTEIDRYKLLKKLDNIDVANKRMKNIADSLGAYSRLDSDNSKHEVISVNKVIDETIQLISEIYSKEGISILLSNHDLEYYTLGNAQELQQVVMNLLSNARDATEEQEERKISIAVRSEFQDRIILDITDNGQGIPKDMLDQILYPFFTTKPVGKGTGLGLGISNEILKKMNGDLKVESEVGQGSTFSIVLPAVHKSKDKPL